jgi:hypothetical protein
MRCYWEHLGNRQKKPKNHPPPPNQNPKEHVPKGIKAVADLIVSAGWDLGCILSQLEHISLQVMSLEDAAESCADISAEQEFVGSNLRF